LFFASPKKSTQKKGDPQSGSLRCATGTLSADGVHLHASVADARGQMRGGHLMPGCIVRTTADIVLALLPGWAFGRAYDAETGFKELVVRGLAAP
jgi:hypothetical protein